MEAKKDIEIKRTYSIDKTVYEMLRLESARSGKSQREIVNQAIEKAISKEVREFYRSLNKKLN